MEKRSRETQVKWKWAFFILFIFNIIVAVSIYFALFTTRNPVVINEDQAPSNLGENVKAIITLENKDVEALLQEALIANETDTIRQIRVEESIFLDGELSILGMPVSFSIGAEPFLVEGGELQLKVNEIQLGNLSLPIKQTMNIMLNQFSNKLPIELDTENQLITVFLTKIPLENVEEIKLLQIDKEVQEYTFEVTISKENLLQ